MPDVSLNAQNVRVRIAPSPTGLLHIGTARTALFNFLFARKHRGTFILRIEDTDVERSRSEYEQDILSELRWLGIQWDEGPLGISKYRNIKRGERGAYGPYRQSKRTERYIVHIKKLIESGSVFWCPHSKENLKREKQEQMQRNETPRHICSERYREASKYRHIDTSREGVLRFRTPLKEKISFRDLIRGDISFNLSILGDFSVAKNPFTPLYNFAVVADDYDMKITHIIRGEDHISNTPKQLLIWRALFQKDPPQYAHLPLILGEDRSKLSKRHGTVLVRDYHSQGYLPEALVNFMVLRGWNPGTDQEIFTLDEMIASFSLERVQKSGAVFNQERLDWTNRQYITRLKPQELVKRVRPFLESSRSRTLGGDSGGEILEKLLVLEQPRMTKLSDINELADFFFREPEYAADLLVWRKADRASAKENLKGAEKLLGALPEKSFSKDSIRRILMNESEKAGDRGKFLWPLRVALTGKEASPDPIDIIAILGKEMALKRIRAALKKL